MNITGGIYNGRKILAPDEKITRPTLSKIRQGVFNTLYSLIGEFENKKFLDLFGGSGIMGLEALSRGFKEAYIFEKNPKIAQILKKNYENLGLKANLKIGDSLKLIKKVVINFDVVYIDPPYNLEIYEKVFYELKKENFKDSIVIAEHNKQIHIKDFILIKEKEYSGKYLSFWKQI